MKTVQWIKRISAICMVLMLVLGMVPSAAYKADETATNRILTVNVDTNKATVSVYKTNDTTVVVEGTIVEGGLQFSLSTTDEYTLTITTTEANSAMGDGVYTVVNETGSTITGIDTYLVDGVYTEPITVGTDALNRTVTLKSEFFYDYIIKMTNTDKGSVVVTPTNSIGAVIADPIISETKDSYTYRLCPYEVYEVKVTATTGEKLDVVLGQPVSGALEYTAPGVVLTGDTEQTVSFYSDTKFNVNVTMASENGQVVVRNKDIENTEGGNENFVGEVTTTGASSVEVTKGGNYILEVIPNENYGVSKITVDNVEQQINYPADKQSFEQLDVMSDVDVYVEYESVYDVTVNVSSSEEETAEHTTTLNAEEITEALYTTKILENGIVELVMTPAEDYYVSGISVKNGTDTDAEAQEVALSDVEINEGVYTYKIDSVTEAITINVTYAKVPAVTDSAFKDDSVFTWKTVKDTNSKDISSTDVKTKDSVVEYVLMLEHVVEISEKDNKTLSLSQNGPFAEKLSISDTQKVESIYVYDSTSTYLEGSIKKYNFEKPVQVILDDTKPTVTIENADQTLWLAGDTADGEKKTTGNIVITAAEGTTAEDTSVAKVVYVMNEKASDADILAGTEIAWNNGTYVLPVNSTELINWRAEQLIYYVYAINESGCISEVASRTVMLDSVPPTITKISAQNTTGLLDKIFTKNDTVELQITADDVNGAGIREVELYVKAGDSAEYEKHGSIPATAFTDANGEKYAVFQLELNSYVNYSVYAIAKDNVGNVSEQYSAIQGTSGDITSNTIYFDSAAPTIKIADMQSETLAAKDEFTYYTAGGVFTPSFTIKDYDTNSDSSAGFASYSIKINTVEVLTKTYDTRVVEDIISITESDYSNIQEAASYVIEVEVMDAAGNTITKSYTCHVDTMAPTIGKIEASNGKSIENYNKYDFFSKGKTTYQIPLTETGAGIGYVTYKLDNLPVIYAANVVDEETAQLDGSVAVLTEIPDEYKGSITVKVFDKVGNHSEETIYVIVEPEEEKSASIPSIVEITPQTTSHKDAGGYNLYSGNTELSVVVEDAYSGIAQVEWSVEGTLDKGKDSTGNIVSVQRNGDSWKLSDVSWQMEEDSDNLVTKLTGKIPVTHDSNNIIISVTVTDNAGNRRTQSQIISIDKTSPKVEISFNTTEPDTVYATDRVATITIYDNNFIEGNTNVKITNTDGTIPNISGWTSNNNATNLAYSTTVTFTADGDYNMEVSTTDSAKHMSNVAKIEQFTIDKTAPTISVTYDNTPSVNETYFASARTATIAVNEHNFDANSVTIEGVATFNGSPATFPVVTGWVSSGDSNTTTLVFNQDALFSYKISITDTAGNSVEHTESEFTVDTTVPVIEISGVEDMSANNGVVAPVITITDENYDPNGVNIELIGANQGQVQANGSFSNIANGQVFSFADFAEEQEYDDLYTLNVTKTDMAGNMFEDSISFSVNRFGSVYTLSDELAAVNGKYVKEAVDVVITETNIDGLDLDTVKVVLTINGTPRTLVYGEDYTIRETGGNGSWSQYEYRIGKELFQEDGAYSVAIYSVDRAGNVNENIHESKEAEVFFGIDTVNPIITAIDLESNKTYEETTHEAKLSITDNLVLGDVTITVNGEVVEYTVNGTEYTFILNESNKAQTIVVTVTDAAGNTATMTFEDVWVTTNTLVRLLNSPIVVVAGVGTVGVAGVGGGAFFLMKRKNIIKVKRK